MITCKLAACANRIIVDAASNQVSIIDLLDEMASQSFPIVVPSVHCLFLLKREQADASEQVFRLEVRLEENVIFQTPITANFGENLINRSIVGFEGFVIPGIGTLCFELTLGGQVLASSSVLIKQINLPQPTVTAPATTNLGK
jgi:hypothetical protein